MAQDRRPPEGGVSPSAPTLRATLARTLVTALGAATLVDALLVALNSFPSAGAPFSIGLVFWVALFAFYLAPLLLVALLAQLLGRLSRADWLPHGVLAAAGAFVVVAIVIGHHRDLPALLAAEGPPRVRWLLPLTALAATLTLLVASLWPLARWRLPAFMSLATSLAALAALAPVRDAARPAPVSPEARLSGERVLVVGIDGADWRYIDMLIARGELPNLAALKAKGAFGRLQTFKPTLSPIVWTTIATGMPPKRHGIRGFTVAVVAGTGGAPLSRLATARNLSLPQRMLSLKPVKRAGVATLVRRMCGLGLIREEPVTSRQRRVPAYWNIAARARLPVNVVTWWATWPAEPVLGTIVSQLIFGYSPLRSDKRVAPLGLTWPPSLFDDIAPLIQWQGSVTLEQARSFVDLPADRLAWLRELWRFEKAGVDRELAAYIFPFETTRLVALEIMRRGKDRYGAAPDTLVLFRIVDKMSHLALSFSELEQQRSGATPEQVRRWGRIVTGAYRAADLALGELTAAFGEGTVIVISDHGFGAGSEHESVFHANHDTAPDGIFLAAGPLIRPGVVTGMSVYDVLPLLLYLKGLPVADDMPGRVQSQVFADGVLERRPVQHVPTYGAESGTVQRTGQQDRKALEEHWDELRSLGYIQ